MREPTGLIPIAGSRAFRNGTPECVETGASVLAADAGIRTFLQSPVPAPRVLHIVESLDRGAVENWLLRTLDHAGCRGIHLDWSFYCQLNNPGAMDGKAQSLGAKVIHSPVPIRRTTEFVLALRRELIRGRYDVLHCHHDLISGVYLAAALGLRVTRRIVHVHNTGEEVLTPNWLKQVLYREPLRNACLHLSDAIAANSNHALDTFLAGRRRRQGRDVVCYCGIDPEPFRTASGNRSRIRHDIGIPEDALILLFAGRMVPEKNPVFAVEVLAELRRRNARVFGVFAGAGSLEMPVRRRVYELNLNPAVRLLGWRDDLPELMSCCDLFIMPSPDSPMEGFGLAVVEAQLAGLRLLLSRGIADDPLLPGTLFRRLPLAAGPALWADAAIEMLRQAAPSRSVTYEALLQSPFHPDRALSALIQLHSGPPRQTRKAAA